MPNMSFVFRSLELEFLYFSIISVCQINDLFIYFAVTGAYYIGLT